MINIRVVFRRKNVAWGATGDHGGEMTGAARGAATLKNNDARQGNCGNFPKTIIYVNNNHDYDDG
jgi:hypothetical protein